MSEAIEIEDTPNKVLDALKRQVSELEKARRFDQISSATESIQFQNANYDVWIPEIFDDSITTWQACISQNLTIRIRKSGRLLVLLTANITGTASGRGHVGFRITAMDDVTVIRAEADADSTMGRGGGSGIFCQAWTLVTSLPEGKCRFQPRIRMETTYPNGNTFDRISYLVAPL